MGMRRVGALFLAAVLATGLAACGDDGDGGGGIALEDIDDDASASGSTAEDDDGADDSGGDVGDLGEFSSEECQDLIGALTGFGGAFTGDSADVDFGDLADNFEGLADGAPEIEDELGVLADAYREFDDALGDDVDFSDPDIFTSPEFAEAAAAFDSPEVVEASDAVSSFFDDACGAG